MSLTDLLWLATAAYGVHILEQYQLNWRDWARAVIGLPVEWSDLYVVNALGWSRQISPAGRDLRSPSLP
jgi:hypothetical protein